MLKDWPKRIFAICLMTMLVFAMIPISHQSVKASPSELNITGHLIPDYNYWLVDLERINSADIAERPGLKGWKAGNANNSYAAEVGPGYSNPTDAQNNPLTISSFKGYDNLEFYVKVSSGAAFSSDTINVASIMQINGTGSWVYTPISKSEAVAGWVKVIVPLNSFPGFSTAVPTAVITQLVLTVHGVNYTERFELSVSDALVTKTVRPPEIDITGHLIPDYNYWLVDLERINSADIAERPGLKGWKAGNANNSYAAEVGPGYSNPTDAQNNPLTISSFKGYDNLEFYVKVSSGAAFSSDTINVASILQIDGVGDWVYTPISKSEAIAGWVKVVIPLNNFPGFSTAVPTAVITQLVLTVHGVNYTERFELSVSDALATKTVKPPKIDITSHLTPTYNYWLVDLERLNPADIAERPELKGWKAGNSDSPLAAEVGPGYENPVDTKGNLLTISSFDDYDNLEFYVKISNGAAFSGDTINVASILQIDGVGDWVYTPISKSEAITGWVKVVVPLNSFPGFSSAASTAVITKLILTVHGVNSAERFELSVSDVLAVMEREQPEDEELLEIFTKILLKNFAEVDPEDLAIYIGIDILDLLECKERILY